MPDVVNLGARRGWHAFDCAGCGIRTTVFAPGDTAPVCATCRHIVAHDLPADAARAMRADMPDADRVLALLPALRRRPDPTAEANGEQP